MQINSIRNFGPRRGNRVEKCGIFEITRNKDWRIIMVNPFLKSLYDFKSLFQVLPYCHFTNLLWPKLAYKTIYSVSFLRTYQWLHCIESFQNIVFGDRILYTVLRSMNWSIWPGQTIIWRNIARKLHLIDWSVNRWT